MTYSRKDWPDFWNTFLFPLNRTLIISENRKRGEGLPEGQQKNTIYSKKATFPHHKRKKKEKKWKKKNLLSKHTASLTLGLSHKRRKTALHSTFLQTFWTKPTGRGKRSKKVLAGEKQGNRNDKNVAPWTPASWIKWTAGMCSQSNTGLILTIISDAAATPTGLNRSQTSIILVSLVQWLLNFFCPLWKLKKMSVVVVTKVCSTFFTFFSFSILTMHFILSDSLFLDNNWNLAKFCFRGFDINIILRKTLG